MSERREVHATTVEEAVEKAVATLGIPREQLNFEVIDAGSAGFLGLGAREARILIEPSDLRDDTRMAHREPPTPGEEGPSLAGETQEEPSSSGVEESEAVEAPQDLILAADEFVTTVVGLMGIDATVDVYDADEGIVVDVATREAGLLIGQKGETIDALQYLVNVCVYRDRPFSKRIVIDSEGYRQRRIEAIRGMANRTARRAVREKRPLNLPPMPAAERRVVHLFLQENPDVATSSEGKGDERRVVITPA